MKWDRYIQSLLSQITLFRLRRESTKWEVRIRQEQELFLHLYHCIFQGHISNISTNEPMNLLGTSVILSDCIYHCWRHQGQCRTRYRSHLGKGDEDKKRHGSRKSYQRYEKIQLGDGSSQGKGQHHHEISEKLIFCKCLHTVTVKARLSGEKNNLHYTYLSAYSAFR